MYDWLQGLVMPAGVNILLQEFYGKILILVCFGKALIPFGKKSPAVAQHAKLFHLRIQMGILIINLFVMSTSSMSRDFGLGLIF
jgi:hypothetical protein